MLLNPPGYLELLDVSLLRLKEVPLQPLASPIRALCNKVRHGRNLDRESGQRCKNSPLN